MSDDSRTQLQFSVMRLWVSVTLIAVGTAYFGYFKAHENDAPFPLGVGMGTALWFVSGASIGAGVFGLFKRPWLRIFLGMLIALVVFCYLVATAPMQS